MGITLRRLSALIFLAVGFWGHTFAQSESISWSFVDLLTDEQPSGANPEFLIDSQGNFHITYWDRTRDRLVYAQRNATSYEWSFETVDNTQASGFRSSLYLDEQDQVHIAYLVNKGGKAFLNYGVRTETGWLTESVPVSSDMGKYGYDESFPGYTQASLDLLLLPDGEPIISYFDGSIFETSIFHCGVPADWYVNFYTDYDLYMGVAFRQEDEWTLIDTLNVPHNGPGLCLIPDGDRFGEFTNMMLDETGTVRIITNSLHNNDLLMFSASVDDLSEWRYQAIDSTERFSPTGLRRGEGSREGFDFIRMQTSGNQVNLVYGVSDLYAQGTATTYIRSAPIGRRSFFFSRIALDSLEISGYQPKYQEMVERADPADPNSHDGHYRSLFTLSMQGEDSLFIGHYNFQESAIIFQSTENGGLDWQSDTLGQFQTNAVLQSGIWADSLHLFFFETDREQLMWASRSLSNRKWQIRSLLPSTRYARILSSARTAPNQLTLAFTETVQDQLYVGTYEPGSWVYSPIDSSGLSVNVTHVIQGEPNQPYIAYAVEDRTEIKIAHFENDSWVCSTIEDSVDIRTLQGVSTADSLYLLYFDLFSQDLRLASSSVLPPFSWQLKSLEPNALEPTGAYPKMVVDQNGVLHISYRDIFSPYLKYIRYQPGGSFQVDTVSRSEQYFSGIQDLGLLSGNRPVIVFRDELNNNLIMATQEADGEWEFAPIPTENNNLVGSSLQVWIDKSDQIWVFYSGASDQNNLQVTRRDIDGSWEPVPLSNNTAQLSQNYQVHEVANSLYIVGQKTEPLNTGLGMLVGESALATSDLNALLGRESLWVWPNPVQDILHFALEPTVRGPIRIELYDLAGRKLYSHAFPIHYRSHKAEAEILVDFLPNGVYVCTVQVGTRQFTAKFIK